ncbi:MAG: aminoglycoside phosphotransferase family protein [Acidobacteria bacterium]|nr:aminoglycoside phosphotransferase family protein [Acidobacteriota bacterium]
MSETTFDVYGYASGVVLPSLHLENHPFVVGRPGGGGTSSSAWKITIERAPSLLVRFYADLGRARRSSIALRHLERLDLPAPRLRHADLHPFNRFSRTNGYPRYATTESWIEGTRALESPDEPGVALAVARLLARYHTATRTRWGAPTLLGELRPYAKTTMTAALRMIRELGAAGTLGPAEVKEAGARFNAWMPMILKLSTYHLCLNDANRRNFIVTPEGALVAIDIQRISYEPCAEELANALYHFCRRDEILAGRFVETYLAGAGASARETWRRSGPFYTALNTLKRLHRRFASGEPSDADPNVPLAAWKQILTSLAPPQRMWPEPGSDPPEDSTELSRQLM